MFFFLWQICVCEIEKRVLSGGRQHVVVIEIKKKWNEYSSQS